MNGTSTAPDTTKSPPEAPPTGLGKWLPGFRVVRTYRWSYLRHDVQAGLILSALLVPVGMGYAEASGLQPIYGLYATIAPLVAYFLLGPSRILVMGPDSSLAPLIAAVVVPLSLGNPSKAAVLAGTLGVLTGVVCVAAGLARFGFITELLSNPVRYGYLNGIALYVIVSQLPKVLGFTIVPNALLPRMREIGRAVLEGRTNLTALAIGAGSLAIILVLKHWAPKVPGILIAVVLSTVAVGIMDLTAYGVKVVGPMPRGLPSFALPSLKLSTLGVLLTAAVGIAVVAFAETSVLSRTFALRGGYEVDTNQEMVALGAANLVTGLFQGFPISSSAARTPVAESAGARTQVTGLVGAAVIGLLLIVAPALLRNLPLSCLGAVVITAALSIAEIRGVRRLYHQRRSEFLVSLVAFLAVAILGVIIGLGVAVGLALLTFIRRAWRPYDATLGRVPGLKGYHDITRHPEARQIPGLVIYRFDAPLFFANAHLFGQEVRKAVERAAPPARWVMVAAEPITDIDTTAGDMLIELEHDLAASGVVLAFAELKDPVKDRLARLGLVDRIGGRYFFPTIGVAVHTYLRETGIPWTDRNDPDAEPPADPRPVPPPPSQEE